MIATVLMHYPHGTVAEGMRKGIEPAGGSATICQWVPFPYRILLTMRTASSPCFLAQRISETLPKELLARLGAPPKPNYPVIAPCDLVKFDAFILGIPTRYGNFPVQCEELLGRDRPALGERRAVRQVRVRVRLNRIPRRRPGVDCDRGALDAHPPRHHLRAPRVRQGVWPAHEPLRGA